MPIILLYLPAIKPFKNYQNTCPSTGPESGVKMDLTVLVGEGLARREATGSLDAGLYTRKFPD